MSKRVVVIGQGAREHALAHKIAFGLSSSTNAVRDVVVIGGNAGIARDFECVSTDLGDLGEIASVCKRLAPDLVVIGPETFLAQGLADVLASEGMLVFGPTKRAAELEASKYFAKQICADANVITARFANCDTLSSALSYVSRLSSENVVVKVNGLCAGKGVVVCHSKSAAEAALKTLFEEDGFARLGVNRQSVLLEEYLPGSEVSVFGVATGEDVVLFCPMQDYKRLLDHDQGPNTGGMGAVGPLGENDEARKQFIHHIKETIFLPTLKSMARCDRPFSGLLYSGLMLANCKPSLLEFNVRFGDPETQALLFGTRADIVPLLSSVASNQGIDEDYWQQKLLDMDPAISIVVAGEGYPSGKAYVPKPIKISSLKEESVKVFFASVGSNDDGTLSAQGGRVLNVVARAHRVAEARALGYDALKEISFDGMHYRNDIGLRVTDLML